MEKRKEDYRGLGARVPDLDMIRRWMDPDEVAAIMDKNTKRVIDLFRRCEGNSTPQNRHMDGLWSAWKECLRRMELVRMAEFLQEMGESDGDLDHLCLMCYKTAEQGFTESQLSTLICYYESGGVSEFVGDNLPLGSAAPEMVAALDRLGLSSCRTGIRGGYYGRQRLGDTDCSPHFSGGLNWEGHRVDPSPWMA